MIPGHVRIWVCTTPVDMRSSFDGLGQAARQALGEELRGGMVVCFVNKRCTHFKALWVDDTGVCLLYKRAHHARFVVPAGNGGGAVAIDGEGFAQLLAAVKKEVKKGAQGSFRIH
jgi:transposase